MTGVIRLQGAFGPPRAAEATVLAGQPADENSLAAPENVKPTTRALGDVGSEFSHEFPAHSLTVLRVWRGVEVRSA